MCITVNKYNEFVTLLSQTVYPNINGLFANLTLDYKSSSNQSIADLLKEFNSLEKFETKLIFPSIISVFHQNTSSVFAPNISEIMLLTKSKEDKIAQLLTIIEQCIEQKDCEICAHDKHLKTEIELIVDTIKNDYFPLKRKWAKMLEELDPEKASCKNRESGKCKCKIDDIKNKDKELQTN